MNLQHLEQFVNIFRSFFQQLKIMDNKDHHISDEVLLKVSKEIAVKFIEVGRLTPASFETTFAKIYETVKQTVEKK